MEGSAPCKQPTNHQNTEITGPRIKTATKIGRVISSSCVDRRWNCALCHSLVGRKSMKEEEEEEVEAVTDDDEGDEEAEVERRIRTLRRLVPRGEEMEVDALFEETADYIETLMGQVNLMRALVQTIEGATGARRKMGGCS